MHAGFAGLMILKTDYITTWPAQTLKRPFDLARERLFQDTFIEFAQIVSELG